MSVCLSLSFLSSERAAQIHIDVGIRSISLSNLSWCICPSINLLILSSIYVKRKNICLYFSSSFTKCLMTIYSYLKLKSLNFHLDVSFHSEKLATSSVSHVSSEIGSHLILLFLFLHSKILSYYYLLNTVSLSICHYHWHWIYTKVASPGYLQYTICILQLLSTQTTE